MWTWIFGDAALSSTHNSAVDADAQIAASPAKTTASSTSTTPSSTPSTAAKSSSGSSAKAVSDDAATAPAAGSTTPSSTQSTSSSSASSDSNYCISSASAAALAAKAAANGTSEGVYAGTPPWVMETPSMLMYSLTYNGVKTVSVWDSSTSSYTTEQVLDFTASELTIQSMVTYSIQNGQTVYNNAGSGTTTTLIDPHLMVVKMTADLLGLIPQTYDPSNPPPLPVGLTIPLIPILFTDVTTQLAYLNTSSISVPGFDGFAKDGIASPQ